MNVGNIADLKGKPFNAYDVESKPVPLPVIADQIPDELKARPQWVAWRYELKKGHWTKPPQNPRNGGYASTTDPMTWCCFDDALRAYLSGGFDGIGIVVRDDIVGIDLDHIIDSDGAIEPWAQEVVSQFDGCYVEHSPSGTGLRIFTLGEAQRSGKGGPGNRLEIYDKDSPRFLTVTGQQASGAVRPAPVALHWLHDKFMQKAESPKSTQIPQRPAPSSLLADQALLSRARQARNGANFSALFDSPPAEGDDHSSRDLALCNLLAFWAARDAAQIDRLFRQSALMRSKWDGRRGVQTYGERTIREAISKCTETYSGLPTPAGSQSGFAADKEGDGTPPRFKLLDDHQNPDNPGRSNAELELQATPDPLSWATEFILSESEISELRSPEWIIPDIVIRGHLLIIVSEPNGGKTTLFTHLAGEIVAAGYRTYYVNADIAGSNAAEFVELARAGGWTAMLPDMRPGLSMQDVVSKLQKMNDTGADLSDVVFIFDTFKKMTDVIAKRQVREILKLLRSLTAKGMTIILLAHTNKYRDAEGKPVFEGTGDVRADADELIYLLPQKHPDGTMTVSTQPDKVRGDFSPLTFEISRDRNVKRSAAFVDTGALRAADERFQMDEPDIRVILDAIEAGLCKQTEIIEHCKAHRIGKRTVLRLLREYSAGARRQWQAQRGMSRNTMLYHMLETVASVAPAVRTESPICTSASYGRASRGE